MNMNNRRLAQVIRGVACLAVVTITTPLAAQMERFHPKIGEAIEVWRLTHDPAVRDYHNYHNTQCWSPDGRYICFTHFAADEREYGTDRAAEIHLYDLAEDRDVLVERGLNPRWANRKPWLLYTRLAPEDGPRNDRGTQVRWLDLESGRRVTIGYGIGRPMQTDCEDRWLYGIWYPDDSPPRAVRMAIGESAEREVLPGDWGVGYNSLYVNPAHPVIVSRDHNYANNYYATPGTNDIPFKARHFFDHDLAGENRTKPFPLMEGAHFAWSGDGAYFLPGNGPIRGRKWNEPLPSNLHLLANISVGDVCPCGFSGRWICGSTGGGNGPLRIADLRSGEGRVVMPTHSFQCLPNSQDNSGEYDIDAKGSPDATKIAFVSTYDIKNGPAAGIVEGSSSERILVDSTEGFPESGRLVNPAGFGGEVIAYARKTATSFEGLTRGLFGTNASAPLRTDRMLTLLDSLLLPIEKRTGKPLPARSIRDIVKDMESPLMWQRQTDIYVAVVRLPDRPFLRAGEGRVELIPGENHWETRGYHILRDGRKVNAALLVAGATLDVAAGTYTAVAVEWSGLESQPGLPLQVSGAATISVLADPPADFQWASDRWLSAVGQALSAGQAMAASEAIKEVVHVYDGVIARETWKQGQLTRHDDLNLKGRPIRRLSYEGGKLARREYFNRDGNEVSTEQFDADGFITLAIGQRSYPGGQPAWKRDGSTTLVEWHYERGVPVHYRRGAISYAKEGDRWVKKP